VGSWPLLIFDQGLLSNALSVLLLLLGMPSAFCSFLTRSSPFSSSSLSQAPDNPRPPFSPRKLLGLLFLFNSLSISLSDQSLTMDNNILIADFLKDHGTFQRICDYIADVNVGAGPVVPTKHQGKFSYTAVGRDGKVVVQFRSPREPLNNEVIQLAMRVYPAMVPKHEYHSQLETMSI
jgi:hypothetical protein